MYLEYYKLDAKPFQITSDPKFLWLGEKHKEALAVLRYGILDNRGFLLLTGEVGTGKTILINRLITMLDVDTVVATLPDPDLASMDFYKLLADGFKMKGDFGSKANFLICLRDFLHQSHADKKQVLLIIDESQRLNHQLMEDIRVLSNIELHDRKLINIFFVGQPEFNNILMMPQNRALAQRITVRYHIDPLDQAETNEYIQHRLKLAGSKRQLFKKKALEEIFLFSNGIPRLINIICDHALLTGFSRELKEIDDAVIRECARELRIPVSKQLVATAQPVAAAETAKSDTVIAAAPVKTPAAVEMPPLSEAFHSSGWKVLFVTLLLLIVGALAYGITYLSRGQEPRYDVDELTPQKYKSDLEKEKALLEKKLEKGAGEEKITRGAAKNVGTESPAQSGEGAEGKIKSADTAPTEAASVTAKTGEEKKGSALAAQAAAEKASGTRSAKIEAGTGAGGGIEPLPLINEKVLIHFSINSNEIDNDAYVLLDRIATYLAQNPNKIIHVRGYTDASGSANYNESVSRFRANAVKSYLIGKGAPVRNVRVFAMGAVNPIASNDSTEGRGANRRVEIEFPDAAGESTAQ
jgi:general secretion pathway protein A